jgi:hypothetical protein
MRAKIFRQSPTGAQPREVSNSYVREALAKQAANRPAKTPPKPLPVTPALPRVPKPHKRRR